MLARKFLIPAFLLLIHTTAVAAGITLSLDDINDRVRRHNPQLAAARLRIEEAHGRLDHAGRLANPDLDFGFLQNVRTPERGFRLEFMQRFPLTGRLRLEKAVSRAQLAAAEAEVRDAERKLVADARVLAVKLLALQHQRAVRVKQIANSRELAEFMTKRVAAGEASLVDASQVQLERGQLDTSLLLLDSERAALLGELRPLLGMRAAESVAITGELPMPGGTPKGAVDPERRGDYRVPGRVLSVSAHIDTAIAKGAEVALIESRQPGDPPPSVKVTAPLGGIVSSVNIVPGQPVTPDDSLVEITDLSEVHATAAVPEHLVGRLSPGQTAHIRVMAVPGRSFEATLAHLGASADAKSGTLEATFHIENPDGLLRPDMRAEFSIVLSKREGVMSVPRIALQGDVASRTLYRRHYDNSLKHTFVRVPVQIGVMNDRFVEITAGLVAGDEVVTTGAYSLAFAGKGSVSLKAALDAAHGHEHNEDGSEITPGQKTKSTSEKGGDGHKQGGNFSMLTIFSLVSNGLLLVLLVVATLRKPRADEPPKSAAPKVEAH
jgi:hypothetical protein